MRSTAKKVASFISCQPDLLVTDPSYQLATLRYAPEMSEIIWEAKRALKQGCAPEKCLHGTSEVYILKGEDERPIAIFKLNCSAKEYIAYRLDHKGFAGVPPTVMTTLSHPIFGGEVSGSCQLFVENSITAVELTRKHYAEISPTSIRRIAQFDIRMINADRHTSNILIRNKHEAVPIDHGFTLPNELRGIDFVWLFWSQAATPFAEDELAYISYLDPDQDRAFLIEEGCVHEKIANRFYVATMLLKQGAIHGLYPNLIGDMLAKTYHRNAPDSMFETLIKRLLERNAKEWVTFTKYVAEEIEKIVSEYETNQHTDFSIFGGV